ncbi:VOC family protein [Amycolatopsis sp. FBCC-B4732]|uniref:VOC family protein n=1 Tax=Amycolatopsis sp. FBCC-B4732 TaxID=3079339 RepID=UPI001FF143F8|nr:VOC family protein [Amycolatopsis sp. FBCC-B4732]UOX90000.1 VOC family protein [Amycolatopsis sp. FBCC-B4732]
MTSVILTVTIDCVDAESLSEFWCRVLGYAKIRRFTDAKGVEYIEVGGDREPVLLFQPVPDAKSGKNRLHLDMAPAEGSLADEVRRLVGLGARLLVDDPECPWTVLADPEGNEFCVLPRA